MTTLIAFGNPLSYRLLTDEDKRFLLNLGCAHREARGSNALARVAAFGPRGCISTTVLVPLKIMETKARALSLIIIGYV